MSNKIVIGLTGNIATGKSLVLRMLQELGATVIDADKLVHQLMRRGGSVYQAIVNEFGNFILDNDGQISRVKLGKIAFSDPTALSRLEALTHPGVITEVKQQVANAPSEVVAVEAIKLFESGIADECDSNWVVVAPPEIQYKRLIERRRMKPDQAKQRILAQSPQKEKAKKASVIINNSGALVKTWSTVKNNYVKLLKTKSAALVPEPEPAPRQETATDKIPAKINIEDITLRRAKRGDLQGMAQLVSLGTKNALSPDIPEMMEALFSRAYMVAMLGEHTIGMIGWQTENLVAGVQDFYVLRNDLWASVGQAMLEKLHDEINKLSCEVCLIFVLKEAGSNPISFLEEQEYEVTDADRLIQDWREAAVEWQMDNSLILFKKIREQRIMVPM